MFLFRGWEPPAFLQKCQGNSRWSGRSCTLVRSGFAIRRRGLRLLAHRAGLRGLAGSARDSSPHVSAPFWVGSCLVRAEAGSEETAFFARPANAECDRLAPLDSARAENREPLGCWLS